MTRPRYIAIFSAFLSVHLVCAQEPATSPVNEGANLKTLVVAEKANSASVIAVPPVTSVRFALSAKKRTTGGDDINLPSGASKEADLNGLQAPDLLPWHIVVAYDQFDEDGDNVHSGIYEEFWAGPTKYKRIYKSDDFNQTDYGTETGLYRSGDQHWPDRAQAQVRDEVIAPFTYAATLRGLHGRNVERTFNGYKLQCVLVEDEMRSSDPTQYCFEPNSFILRYSRGFGRFQTVYNRIVRFQGRNLARDVDVTDGGKPYLKLRVEVIEQLTRVEDKTFSPPPDAIRVSSDRISGVSPQPIDMSSIPQWPAGLRTQRFTVTVEIAIGKNGHVLTARGISGPPDAYMACEDAVRKWAFKPYLVLGKPVEVELKVECRNN